MKSIYPCTAIVLLCTLLASGCSSEFDIKQTEVPKEVLSAFTAKYPSAKDVSWEVKKENGNLYFEAEWKENGKEKEAEITPDGSSIKEE